MNLLGVIQVNSDSVIEQIQAWLASYPILVAVGAIVVLSMVKKLISFAILGVVLLVIWCVLRGSLVL